MLVPWLPWCRRRSPPGRGATLGAVEQPLTCHFVHRVQSSFDDWSHPKGKLKRGEAPLAGALREVAEETGHSARPGTELPTMRYLANDRPKEVRYWATEAGPGTFTPNEEVDRMLWLSPTAARSRLTQPRGRSLMDALLESLRLA
ncbi:NUDIX hydrolase [Streptomyces sp. NPDC057301]|uniref:NUDIX hydrolase n=1 Tax=Streptomyces sp. NPDC057301 TaxID=3346093 RepID=UPI0036308431